MQRDFLVFSEKLEQLHTDDMKQCLSSMKPGVM